MASILNRFSQPHPRETPRESLREGAQPVNLFQAVQSLIHDSAPQTPKGIASDVGVGYSYLLKAADPEQQDVQFQTRLVGPVTNAAKNDVLIDFLARQCGGVFYRLALPGEMDTATAKTLREFGEYLTEVANAMSDHRVTPEEYHRVKSQGHEAIAAILAHLAGLRVKAGLPEDAA